MSIPLGLFSPYTQLAAFATALLLCVAGSRFEVEKILRWGCTTLGAWSIGIALLGIAPDISWRYFIWVPPTFLGAFALWLATAGVLQLVGQSTHSQVWLLTMVPPPFALYGLMVGLVGKAIWTACGWLLLHWAWG